MKKIKKALFALTLLAVLSMVIAPAAAQVTWSSDIRLTDDPADSMQFVDQSIAVDSNDNIHITWCDARHGDTELYYTKLDNNGNTLVDDTRLTDAPDSSENPCIAVDSSDNIHITWPDKRDGNYEIYYTKLDNNGNTLVDDTRLTDAPETSAHPTFAVDSSNNIHISWYDKRDGNYEIYYTKLDNNGNTVVDDTRLTVAAYALGPSVAVDSGDNIHIAWRDKRDGNYEIYYTKLDNNGNTLVDDTRLTDNTAYSMYPSIAADSSDNMHISWHDKRDGNYEIYYTKLSNTGATLIDDTRLTDASGYSYFSGVAVDSSDNIHIVWRDKRHGNGEIYYTKLDNNGNTVVDDTRLTDDPAYSKEPSIAVDSSNNIHITWYDKRDGNYEIYYKSGHKPDLTPTAITTPASIIATQSNTIEATIANIGAGNAGSFNVSLSADGTPVDTASVDSLSGGTITDVSFSWTPDSAGGYELCVIADSDGAVGDSDETNNGLCKGVEVTAPDLNVTEKFETLDDGTFTVTYTVKNVGGAEAGASNTTIYVDGAAVREDPVPALAAGANYTNTVGSFDCPCGTTVTVKVCTDNDNVVSESDEANNCMANELECEVCVIPVDIDVKPGSCPNPLNLKSKGVLPVAVLGTAEFDVTTIDPGTILLIREGCEGVAAPIRWSYEDVATPFTGELCDCHDLNGDGYIDLTLKFDTQELVSNLKLDEVAGETIPLAVTGDLKAENGGTPIEGKDCIRVL